MTLVKCIDKNWESWACNARLEEVTLWLEANAGKRWTDWDWLQYGCAVLSCEETAIIFRLKYGI